MALVWRKSRKRKGSLFYLKKYKKNVYLQNGGVSSAPSSAQASSSESSGYSLPVFYYFICFSPRELNTDWNVARYLHICHLWNLLWLIHSLGIKLDRRVKLLEPFWNMRRVKRNIPLQMANIRDSLVKYLDIFNGNGRSDLIRLHFIPLTYPRFETYLHISWDV